MRYFINLAYNGTRFCGWQIQPNAVSIQEIIQKELSKILQQSIEIVGAGRTDSGVHAKQYYAHFDIEQPIDTIDITYKLNRMIGNDIVIYSIFEVPKELHARFSAKTRTYTYTITKKKNPFLQETALYIPYNLDVALMNKASELLFQYSDFTSFSKLHTDVNTNNCAIYRAEWTEVDDLIIFTITANRFLRNMVRAIVGTMLEIGQSRITIQQFSEIIESKNRQNAGMSIPPQGLCLVDIEYEEI